MVAAPQRDPQLGLFERPPEHPNVKWLEHFLRERQRWCTAAEIIAATGARLIDREIRALASASEWIISGQKGYKRLECATTEEIDHAAHWLESQAKKMSERACAIRRNAHKVFG